VGLRELPRTHLTRGCGFLMRCARRLAGTDSSSMPLVKLIPRVDAVNTFSRIRRSFRVPMSGIFEGQRAFCSGFDSGSSTIKVLVRAEALATSECLNRHMTLSLNQLAARGLLVNRFRISAAGPKARRRSGNQPEPRGVTRRPARIWDVAPPARGRGTRDDGR
jgi:hypothetical protein